MVKHTVYFTSHHWICSIQKFRRIHRFYQVSSANVRSFVRLFVCFNLYHFRSYQMCTHWLLCLLCTYGNDIILVLLPSSSLRVGWLARVRECTNKRGRTHINVNSCLYSLNRIRVIQLYPSVFIYLLASQNLFLRNWNWKYSM